MSALIFEYGTKSSDFCADAALRTRARRSEIGSVTVLIYLGGWRGLDGCGFGRSRRGDLLGPVAERHSHLTQERFGFLVRLRGGHDGNIKSDVALDFIELDLGEDRLVGNAERVVAVPVERFRRNASEIADARQRRFDEALQKFIHMLAAQ